MAGHQADHDHQESQAATERSNSEGHSSSDRSGHAAKEQGGKDENEIRPEKAEAGATPRRAGALRLSNKGSEEFATVRIIDERRGREAGHGGPTSR
jgi:hypothetical protein